MNAVAFDVLIKNGSVVIPEEYKAIIPSVAVVTIVYRIDNSENKQNSWNVVLNKNPSKSGTFPNLKINMSGYKFNREEANER